MSDVQAGASFFVEVSEDGEILRCKGDTFGLLGLSPGAIEGLSLYDLVTEGDVWLATDAVAHTAEKGTIKEERLSFNDHKGDSIPFLLQLVRVAGSDGQRMIRIFAMSDEGGGQQSNVEDSYGDDITAILADVEGDLRENSYDSPTLSIYSLNTDAAEGDDIDAILETADRMAASVKQAAEGQGTSFRVDQQTVSVLHGTEFDAEAASATAATAAGPSFNVGRAAIDLADADLDVQEKLDVIEKSITATRLAEVKLEAGTKISATQAREALDRQLTEKRQRQPYSLEVAYSTSSGAPVLSLLSFENPLSALGEKPSSEEFRLALSLLEGRIEAAQKVAEKQETPACVVMSASMLARLGRGAAQAFRPNVLILASGVGKLSAKDGERFAAVFAHAKRAIVDGTDLATSSALQRLISKTNNVEFIRVPRERFGEKPAEVAESFRKIAQLCARRDVALYVNGIDDMATALELKQVSQICLGGPAVFPGLFTKD